MRITIRPLTEANISDALKLVNRLFNDSRYTEDFSFDRDHALRSIQMFLGHPDYAAWLAYDGDKIVGGLAAHISDTIFSQERAGFEDSYYVFPEYQDQGIGKLLFYVL